MSKYVFFGANLIKIKKMYDKELFIAVHLARKFSNKAKPFVELDKEVDRNIENMVFKPKQHPGILKPRTITLPDNLITAIQNVLEEHPIKALTADSEVLKQHLHHRLAPVEVNQLLEAKEILRSEVIEKAGHVNLENDQQEELFKQTVKDKVNFMLKKKLYNWVAMNYDNRNSLLYLVARVAPNYAVLFRILSEINARDHNFKPRSLFDFGSGIGTGMWAANFFWQQHFFEYYNVDASSSMNDLAHILLQDGRGSKQISLKGVYFRQFLPSKHISYDLVLCAYSLLELPSRQMRFQTLLNLWNKTGKYLVIVEYGTNAGFQIINEARDFILNVDDNSNKGHVFSPCPHDLVCPRFLTDNTPCNFQAAYFTLPIGKSVEVKRELFSYVVLQKCQQNDTKTEWPRIVRETLVRSKHTICRLCTSSGNLHEVIFTASKHGKTTYHCARSSKWGDLLPVSINYEESK